MISYNKMYTIFIYYFLSFCLFFDSHMMVSEGKRTSVITAAQKKRKKNVLSNI